MSQPAGVVGLTVWFHRGLYVGRDQGERPEEHPTTARLHSALVAAAAAAPGGLTPNRLRALEWLESHPPRYLSIPETLPADTEPLFHYRNTGRTYLKNVPIKDPGTGTGKKSKAVIDLHKAHVRYLYGTLVLGPVCWGWDAGDVPDDVTAVLADLASRVFYLGSAESHAKMHWGPLHWVTHRGLDTGERIGLGAKDVQAPRPGRTDELVALNRKLAVEREASIAKESKARTKSDAVPTTDGDRAQKAAFAGLDLRRKVGVDWYMPVGQAVEAEEVDDVPWPRGVWIPLDKSIGTADRVNVARQLHRALVNLFAVAAVDAEVPAWVTGHHEYEYANNVAYQYIPPLEVTGVRHSRGTSGGLLVLLPPECDPTTRDTVVDMAGEFWPLRTYGPGSPVPVNPGRWWLPPADGSQRLWRTYPLMLSDTKGVAPALALAVKHLFRDRSQLPRYAVVTASRRDNVQIGDFYPAPKKWKTAPTANPAKPDKPVIGYTALIALDDTVNPCAALALGKTRHMGGGLLLPVDVPDLKAMTG
jgi:CRISPR-associated protein Csb2